MRVIKLILLGLCIAVNALSQSRFEIDVTTKLGYYYPVNQTDNLSNYFPENSFSPAAGISLGYKFFKSTSVFLGMEYCHLSPKLNDHSGNELDVTWQSLNVPFNIQQGIGRNFYIVSGITLIRQLKGVRKEIGYNSYIKQQKLPEYNLQAGIGYKLKNLRISLGYYRGFKKIEKSTSVGENSWFSVNVLYQEVYLKFEYPIWEF